MKKILLTFIMFLSFICITENLYAQQRIQVGDGIYLATYGNVTVIENDKLQQTIQIKVKEKSDGLYEIFCQNKYVKTVTKAALKTGIKAGITAATSGTLTWAGKIAVDTAVEYAYDSVCEYFE